MAFTVVTHIDEPTETETFSAAVALLIAGLQKYSPDGSAEVYDIGSQESITVKDAIEWIAKEMFSPTLRIVEFEIPDPERPGYILNIFIEGDNAL